MKNKTLITGVAGAIGSVFYKAFQKRFPAKSLLGVDNFKSGTLFNLVDFKGEFCDNDVSDVNFWASLDPDKIDAIYHFASNVDTCDYNSVEQFKNVNALKCITSFCSINNIPLLWTSSASVYGNQTGKFKEDMDLYPESPYAISKMLAENVVRQYQEMFPEAKVITIRPFNVYCGEAEKHKGKMQSMPYQMLNTLTYSNKMELFAYGEQCRDFIFVEDLVDLMLHAMYNSEKSEIFNGGTGTACSFNELFNIFKELMAQNAEIVYKPKKVKHFQTFTCADMTKVETLLNWKPKFDLKAGIVKMIEDFNCFLKHKG